MSENTNQNKKIADLIFPNTKKSYEEFTKEFKFRSNPEGRVVTRFAPSPTGFMHLGSVYAALVAERFAHNINNKGTFFLRIEDTDAKREVENGILKIINSLKIFGIEFDEGVTGENSEKGDFGPYKQSERKEIYEIFAKHLIETGKGYVCFMTSEEIDEIRKTQESNKERPGIYGKWSKYRDADFDQVKGMLEAGKNFVVRIKADGDGATKSEYNDLIRGKINVTSNDIDYVLLKSDGLPTYHFAHLVDDYLMGTTHVIRAEEWLPSLPLHLQLFEYFGFKAPRYAHISHIMKLDSGGKRKLSKRKDPEANVEYYKEMGFPFEGVLEYLMNIANSHFEDWRKTNATASYRDFDFRLDKVGVSGALFDLVKLSDVCKNFIASLNAADVYDRVLAWANEYDSDLVKVISSDTDYTLKVLSIERGPEKSRKDLSKFSEFRDLYGYFYDELFENDNSVSGKFDSRSLDVITRYADYYEEVDSKDVWFEAVKDFAEKEGYSRDTKSFKEHPDKYVGSIGDFTGLLRFALTKRDRTPDLYEILLTLGKNRALKRLQDFRI